MTSLYSELIGQLRARLQSQDVRNLIRGGIVGIAATVGNRGLTLISAVMLARMLHPDGYGIYALAIALMAILTLGTEFGMYALLIRESAAAHSRDSWPELLGMRRSANRFALLMASATAAVVSLVIWATPLTSDPRERLALTCMLLLLPIATMVRLESALLAGLRRLAASQLGELFLLPALSFSLLLALYLTVGTALQPYQAVLTQIVAGVGALAIIGLMVRAAFAPARAGAARAERITGFQRRAVPFLIIGAAGTVAQQLDTVIVSAFLSHAQTAQYRVAAQAATLTSFGIQIVQTICSPYFARLFVSGELVTLARLYRWVTVAAATVAAGVTVTFVAFGDVLIRLTFGAEFVGARPMMIILSIGYLINVVCGPAGTLMAMTGDEQLASRAFVVCSTLAVAISITLVRPLGPLGVALGTGFGFASYHLFLRLHIWRRFGF